jgi:uncharacterized membrane protein required for colicin V production
MNWSDIVVVGLIVLFAIIGLSKGFIMSVYKLVAFIVCIFVSIKFAPIFAAFIEETVIFEKIKNVIVENLPLISKEAFASSTAAPTGTEGVKTMLGALTLPLFAKESLLEKMPSSAELVNLDLIYNAIGEELTRMIISVLSLVVLYVALRIITGFIGLLLKGVSNLPVFKQINKLGGFILGALQGFLTVYIICAILVMFNTNPGFSPVFNSIDNSLFAKGFYENNFIMSMLFPSSLV